MIEDIASGIITHIGDIKPKGGFIIVVREKEYLVPARIEFSTSKRKLACLFFEHKITVIITRYKSSNDIIPRFGFGIDKNDINSLDRWKNFIISFRNYNYLKNLSEIINEIKNGRVDSINEKEFANYIEKLYNERNSFHNSSADEYDLVPDWMVKLVQFVKGSMLCIEPLGIILVREKTWKLLKILSKFDKRAKKKKERSKLPPELIGKNLQYEKQTNGKWIVDILPRNDLCYYEKLYQKGINYNLNFF